jgi:hypothetical protein
LWLALAERIGNRALGSRQHLLDGIAEASERFRAARVRPIGILAGCGALLLMPRTIFHFPYDDLAKRRSYYLFVSRIHFLRGLIHSVLGVKNAPCFFPVEIVISLKEFNSLRFANTSHDKTLSVVS